MVSVDAAFRKVQSVLHSHGRCSSSLGTLQTAYDSNDFRRQHLTAILHLEAWNRLLFFEFERPDVFKQKMDRWSPYKPPSGPTRSHLWKTPSSTTVASVPPKFSPLVAYPLVISLVVKLIDLQDVLALLQAGSHHLSANVRRSCTIAHASRDSGSLRVECHPILQGDPFPTICAFPHLETLAIISPLWKVPQYAPSPLLNLPKTLRHLTLWATQEMGDGKLPFRMLCDIPYASEFPDLETLRLCCTTQRNYFNTASSWARPIKLENIPPHIRTLSLVGGGFILTELNAFQICQPIGCEPEYDLTAAMQSSYLPPVDELAERPSWKFRFNELEFFEWSMKLLKYTLATEYEARLYQPHLKRMPPRLKTFIWRDTIGLEPLPTQLGTEAPMNAAMVESDSLRLQCSLTSFAYDSHTQLDWEMDDFPRTLTELDLQSLRSGLIVMSQREPFSLLAFTALRSLTVKFVLDTNQVLLPDSLTSMRFQVPSSAEAGFIFQKYGAPASLTHLGLSNAAQPGTLAYLPPTLRSLHLQALLVSTEFKNYVLPWLPKHLRSLRLQLTEFCAEFLELLPRGLEDLFISASMLLPEWQVGKAWDITNVPFDVRGLPPTLTSLSLCPEKYRIIFPVSHFAQLPRSLRFLEISSVLIRACDPNSISQSSPNISAATSSASTAPLQSESSSDSGFFGRFTNWVSSIINDSALTSEETVTLKAALRSLPSDCWCNIYFKTEIQGDTRILPSAQPKNLFQEIALLLPNCSTVSTARADHMHTTSKLPRYLGLSDDPA